MKLPEDLDNSFWQEVTQYEEEKRMPYITSVEIRGIQKGIEEGKRQALIKSLEVCLELKFGSEGITVLPEIAQIQNVEILSAILNSIKTVNSIEELQQIYQ